MRYVVFVFLVMISAACLADESDESRKALMKLITDEHRNAVLNGYVESIEKDLPLAEGGDVAAMYRLYKNFNLLANIHKIPDASDHALKWLRRSAELSYPESLSTLGHIYKVGDETFHITKDLEKAAELFKLAWE